MVVLEHSPAEAKADFSLALVGKGIVFDTGGLTLKSGRAHHVLSR